VACFLDYYCHLICLLKNKKYSTSFSCPRVGSLTLPPTLDCRFLAVSRLQPTLVLTQWGRNPWSRAKVRTPFLSGRTSTRTAVHPPPRFRLQSANGDARHQIGLLFPDIKAKLALPFPGLRPPIGGRNPTTVTKRDGPILPTLLHASVDQELALRLMQHLAV
jgi:hypothetical protein